MIRKLVERNLVNVTGSLPDGHAVEFAKEPKFGDVSSNIAFLLARTQNRAPDVIARELAAMLAQSDDFSRVEVGGRGFINFTLADQRLSEGIAGSAAPQFGRSNVGAGRRVLVEFVSANPTGPLNVVNARAGAFGAALVQLLKLAGFDAVAEFYINDSGSQVQLLGESVAARIAELNGAPLRIPEGGYPGDYLVPIARQAAEKDIARDEFGSFAMDCILAQQRETLARFGISFDSFVRESSIRLTNAQILERLSRAGHSYEKEGAVWFRAQNFGDTEDRVIVRSNGEPSYALTDINYHRLKFERGYEWLITIWGPDHHGDIARLKGGLNALGYPGDKLDILLVQWTTLLRAGKKLGMSKRAGEYITIDDVLDEIGSDALKFFLLMRRASQHLEFDLELAKSTTKENPVYYAQYSHARIASILRFAHEKGVEISQYGGGPGFTSAHERLLARLIVRFPDVAEAAALALEPHRLTYYVLELANAFHQFYENARVVSENAATTAFRIGLCQSTKNVLRQALSLLGVSAPERM